MKLWPLKKFQIIFTQGEKLFLVPSPLPKTYDNLVVNNTFTIAPTSTESKCVFSIANIVTKMGTRLSYDDANFSIFNLHDCQCVCCFL